MKSVLIAMLLIPLAALADWTLDQGVDSLTDAPIYVARTDYQIDRIHTRSAFVRCAGAEFDVYFDFDEYLGDDLVAVRYRVDTGELEHDRWSPSARGTVVFVGNPEDVAYKLVHGSQFIIEAENYRGVRHRSTFSLLGSSAAILPVMTACGVDDVPPSKEPAPQPRTEPAKPTASTTGMWAVQLASFSNKENAEALAASLRKQGYAAFLSQLQTSAGELHRVRVGPQKDLASAEAMAARLLKANHKGQVVPHP